MLQHHVKGNITVNFICYLKIKEGREGEKKGEKEEGREGGQNAQYIHK